MTEGAAASPSILYLVAESIWPSTSGGRVRSAGIANALAEIGDLTILALDETARDDVWGAACRRFERRGTVLSKRVLDRARGAIHGSPRLLERLAASGAVEAFDTVLEATSASIVVLSIPFVGPFIDRARRHGALVLFDAHESLVRANQSILRTKAPIRTRIRALLDLNEARRFEPREYARVDQIWVASPIERDYFVRRLPPADVREVPNLAPAATRPPSGVREITSIAFVGSYGYAPNEEAALVLINEVMPVIRERGGPRELVLIGRDPTQAMRTAAAEDREIRITGVVPDAVEVLLESGILVVPLRAGAGSRIKILEAMQAGVPVVTTARGLEGLSAQPERDVLLAETPEKFALAVARLASDADLRQRVVESARAFVRAHHSQPAISAAVVQALGSAKLAASA